MGLRFGLKTKNIKHNVRKKNPISGLDIDTSQLFIYVMSGIFIFFIFMSNTWYIWKLLLILGVIIMTINLAKKYDGNTINNIVNDYGRTNMEWFRIYLKKIINGSKSVDKGASYNYFKK